MKAGKNTGYLDGKREKRVLYSSAVVKRGKGRWKVIKKNFDAKKY